MTLQYRPPATLPFGAAAPFDCEDITDLVIAETAGLCGRCTIRALVVTADLGGRAVHVDLRRLDLRDRPDCRHCGQP